MKVYRYLSKTELNNILNGNIDKLGNEFSHSKIARMNTHKYKKGEKYLHFFKDKESITNIRKLHKNSNADFYICTFEIPKLTLFFGAGKGFYAPCGYDLDFNYETEFAIKTKHFNPKWLKDYVLDNKNKMDDEEFEEITKSL